MPFIDKYGQGIGDKSPTLPEQLNDIRQRAVALLARREHAYFELKLKLVAKGFDVELIAVVLDKLVSEQLLSDYRFAENYVRYRVGKGYGPFRIRSELQERRVDERIISEYLAGDWGWFELAAEVKRRRFGITPPVDTAMCAKQQRFLQYRGFTSEQINAALRQED